MKYEKLQMGVVNRDIKLENTLLDGGRRPLLKICDFGYSKHEKDSLPKSKVGTPGYTGNCSDPVNTGAILLLHYKVLQACLISCKIFSVQRPRFWQTAGTMMARWQMSGLPESCFL